MEEPVCEPPAITLYYISKLASKSVKVLISGEGGDEAFGGSNYRNILWLERLKREVSRAIEDGALAGAFLPDVFGSVTGSARFDKYSAMAQTPFESYYYSRTSSPFQYSTPTVINYIPLQLLPPARIGERRRKSNAF